MSVPSCHHTTPAEGDGFRRCLLASQYKTVLSLSRLSCSVQNSQRCLASPFWPASVIQQGSIGSSRVGQVVKVCEIWSESTHHVHSLPCPASFLLTASSNRSRGVQRPPQAAPHETQLYCNQNMSAGFQATPRVCTGGARVRRASHLSRILQLRHGNISQPSTDPCTDLVFNILAREAKALKQPMCCL